MSRQASPIIPTRWDLIHTPREEHMGPAPQFDGETQIVGADGQKTLNPEYDAWLKEVSPQFQLRRDREKEWERAIRNGMATGRITPQQAVDLGYRTQGHEGTGDWNEPKWGRWQPLPNPLYHVTTNLPAIAQSGVLRSPYELDHEGGRGLGSYGTEPTVSLTHSLEEARNIERAMREGADVASGRLPIERLVEMARTGEGAEKPWLNAMYGTHDWSKGNPRALDDLLLGREPFYHHKLPEDHPLKETGSVPLGGLSAEDWEKHEFYPYPDAPSLETATGPRYLDQAVYRNTTPEEKAKQAFEWWRNPWAPMRGWVGQGPSDPLFASTDADWYANLDPSHIGIVQTQPVPGAHGYPMGSMGEWRIPTGEAVNITHLNGEPYPPRLSSVKLAHPLYTRWVFSPATGKVTLADNSGDPLAVKYHTDLARELNEPNLVHGYAVRIGDGWRLSDWESRPVEDPYIVAQVMRALLADGPESPQEGSWEDPEPPDWSRVHHSLPGA